jgi:hypothetical protein
LKLSGRLVWTIAVLVFLWGLIASFPARLAYAWFAPQSIDLTDPQGTVWNGSARQLIIHGTAVADLSWNMAFWPLLTGDIDLLLTARPGGGLLSAEATFGSDGTLQVSGLRAAFPVETLQGLIPLVGVSGSINVNLDSLSIREGRLETLRGTVLISDLEAGFISNDNLGSYLIEANSTDTGILASVEDREAVLDVAGTITLSSKWDYQFVGQIAETAATPAALRSQLAILGTPNERGQRTFRFEGAL